MNTLFPREISFLEKLFIALGLILAAGAPFPLIRFMQGQSFDAESGDPLVQLVWVAVYVIAALPLLLMLPRALWLWRQNIALVLLVTLTLISSLWSLEPLITFRRSIPAIGTFVFATYLALRLTPLQMVKLTALALGLAALNSLLVVVTLPRYGIMEGVHEGRWRGIYEHKNVLGRHMGLGVLACMVAGFATVARWRMLFFGLAVLCGFLLIMAESATALVITLATVFCWGLLELLRRSARFNQRMGAALFVVLLVGGGMMAALAVTSSDWVFALLGKSADLTQRLPLWQGAWDAVKERPWLGYGYEVFFDGQKGLAWSFISPYLLWEAPHAHNGAIQLLLALGFTGLLLFIFVFVGVCTRATQLAASHTAEPPASWGIVIILLTILVNIPEITILRSNNLLWIAFVYLVLRSSLTLTSTATVNQAPSPPNPRRE
jgi:O-antigen ligase